MSEMVAADVVDCNQPPQGQPGLWCQWIPTNTLDGLEWDEGEKFYHYVEWLEYLIEHFLTPWGLSISGEVSFQGEDPTDCGVIKVVHNKVTVHPTKAVGDETIDNTAESYKQALEMIVKVFEGGGLVTAKDLAKIASLALKGNAGR